MGVLFYNIFLLLYKAGVYLSAPFNRKAKKWIEGRRSLFERLEKSIEGNSNIIWMHCASLGEFEQGRPVIERLRQDHPNYKILITFFSPSGYEVRKNYDGADWVYYLPMDGPVNARKFLDLVKPSIVIFVKYEFWYYYLKKIKYRNIPVILISAIFREHMAFFKWHGAIQRKMLTRFDHLFVQDKISKELIEKLGLNSKTSISGDTRFDQVVRVAENFTPLVQIEKFIGQHETLIAGSTWREDEKLIKQATETLLQDNFKLIIAPHEIDEKHLSEIKGYFPDALFYSQLKAGSSSNVLVIDNIGMLSKLYRYATIAYVGGGMTKKGIHNVLEAAVYGKPVVFGPYYKKYYEATGLIASGGGKNFEELNACQQFTEILESLRNDKMKYKQMSIASENYVRSNTGATDIIVSYIQVNRLLTS